MGTIHLHPNDAVKALGRAAFPEYRGRMYQAIITEDPISLNSHWDGGSRDYFVLINSRAQRAQAPQSGTMFDGPLSTPPKVAPTPDLVIVKHSIFCGKDYGLTFYIHPKLAPRMLPASADAHGLTRPEQLVLLAACSLKSSYQGRPIRRDECARKGVSPAEYDAALNSLKAKGLLNKSGAVTVDGRNVANTLPNRYGTF